jgi:hypothetical protein
MWSRTARTRGDTPRICTFASLSVPRSGSAAITTTSGLTTDSDPRFATCGASSITRTSAIVSELVISVSAPARCTITFCGSPDEATVARNPRASASIATNTATVPAMPTTATSDDAHRARALRRLYAMGIAMLIPSAVQRPR